MGDFQNPAFVQQFVAYARSHGMTDAMIREYLASQHTPASAIRFTDLARSAFSGATFGWGDELYGAAHALYGDEPYAEARDKYRSDAATFAREHPTADKIAKLTGAVATAAVPVGEAVSGGSLAMQGLKVGGVLGAAQGVGDAEGGLGAQVRGAVTGGVTGAATGAVLGPLAGAIGRFIANRVRPEEQRAALFLANQLVQSGKSQQEVMSALEQASMAQPGAPVGIVDYLGETGKGALRGMQARPGPARDYIADALEARGSGRPARVEEALDRASGTQRANMVSLRNYLENDLKPVYKANYDRAYTALDGVNGGAIHDPKIAALLDEPTVASLWDDATAIYNRDRSMAAANGEVVPAMPQIVTRTEANGRVAYTPTGNSPNTMALDYLKRAMDDYIDAHPGTNAAGQMAGIRRQMLQRLDELNPAYRDARSVYAGVQEAREAQTLGERAFSRSPDQIAADLAGMDKTSAHVYRIAALNKLRERLSRINGVNAIVHPQNTYLRSQLAQLFETPEQYNQFLTTLTTEGKALSTERFLRRQSSTTPQREEVAALEPLNPMNMREGILRTLSSRGLEFLHNAAGTAMRSDSELERIARMMLTANPDEQRRVFAALTESQRSRVVQMMQGLGSRAGARVYGSVPGLLNNGSAAE